MQKRSTNLINILFCFAAGLTTSCTKSSERVVVYCAQDREYATQIFQSFTELHHYLVASNFDTESNKSVGLALTLQAEKTRPRCDVHWNNEPLGTIRLARAGVYSPYQSPAAQGYPETTRSPDHLWQAFAERARVLVVNTDLVAKSDYPESILDLEHPRWRGKLVLAKPQFGTTATHAACLMQVLGLERGKQFFLTLKEQGVQIVAGNKQVAQGVASGKYPLGLTDSDDAILEVLAGRPVDIIFLDAKPHPQFPRLGVLYLPNTLALVNGSPNPAGAQQLIDYLLEHEGDLALGGGFQIPIHPQHLVETRNKLPEKFRTRDQVQPMNVDFEKAADLWDATQEFLRTEFAR